MQDISPPARIWHPPYGWWIYLVAIFLFNVLIFTTPLLLHSAPVVGLPLYEAFHYTCHQLDYRSLCYFPTQTNSPISDCEPWDGTLHYERTPMPLNNGVVGYEIPVCARDVGIYLFMLVGGLLWPVFFKPASTKWPPVWILLIALVPTAIDGFTQLFGWRESTNTLRLFTGAVMGVVMPFYIIPMLNEVFSFMDKNAPPKGVPQTPKN